MGKDQPTDGHESISVLCQFFSHDYPLAPPLYIYPRVYPCINLECIPSSTNYTPSPTICTSSLIECIPSLTECTPSSTECTLSSTECIMSSTECKINSGYTLNIQSFSASVLGVSFSLRVHVEWRGQGVGEDLFRKWVLGKKI
jgi:hypothetical protein